jgi:F-type H+-transporting ATPase subunit gamma
MPGGGKLRYWKDKLEGYKKYHQIVKTIKMVTLAKYRQTVARTKTRDETLRYTRKVFDQPPISEEEAIAKYEKLLYVPITTNRGSCGALNSNLLKYLEEIASSKMKILCIGKKGLDALPKLVPRNFDRTIINDMKNAMSFQYASYIYDHIQTFEWDRCQIVYARYLQASAQRMAAFNLPTFEDWKARVEEESAGEGKLEGEGMVQNLSMMTALGEKEESVLADFYDFHATLTILNAVCENELSEYASRIVAVENQLNNITGLMHVADYTYNKTRKELITAELLEIIGTMIVMTAGGKKEVTKRNFWEAKAEE